MLTVSPFIQMSERETLEANKRVFGSLSAVIA